MSRRHPRRKYLFLIGLLVVVGSAVAWLIVSRLPLPDGLARPSNPLALADGHGQRAMSGSPAAPTLLVAWIDYADARSGVFWRGYMHLLDDRYISAGHVRLIVRAYAIGQRARSAARAVSCADAQGAFWRYADLLMANQPMLTNSVPFDRARFIAMAGAVGIERTAFDRCLDDPAIGREVDVETTEARQPGNAIRADQLPVFALDGSRLTGLPDLGTLIKTFDQRVNIDMITGGASPPPTVTLAPSGRSSDPSAVPNATVRPSP